MHKGIRLKASIWIEGEDEPAHDFTKLTIQMVRDLLAAPHPQYAALKVTVKKIVEDRNYDEEQDEE